MSRLKALFLVVVILSVVFGFTTLLGVAELFAMACLIFLIQILAFIPAYLNQTERYYDLIGGLSFLLVMVVALIFNPHLNTRAAILFFVVSIWALRLSLFLFKRVSQDGADKRFDDIKKDPAVFLLAWLMQGTWVIITSSCAAVAIVAGQQVDFGWLSVLGLLIWNVGFLIEITADWQKRFFKNTQNSATPFIQKGLWRYSRHPNYFGEIILWFGVVLIALPALNGWQHLTLVSPLFVILLLTKISGIPILETQANNKWRDNSAYQHYKKTTPLLVPVLGKKR